MHRMGNGNTKHSVDEVPILGSSNSWILTCPAFAELIVTVYEEIEVLIP